MDMLECSETDVDILSQDKLECAVEDVEMPSQDESESEVEEVDMLNQNRPECSRWRWIYRARIWQRRQRTMMTCCAMSVGTSYWS